MGVRGLPCCGNGSCTMLSHLKSWSAGCHLVQPLGNGSPKTRKSQKSVGLDNSTKSGEAHLAQCLCKGQQQQEILAHLVAALWLDTRGMLPLNSIPSEGIHV